MDYLMSVHRVSNEATVEYKWFAKYPLLGSAIIQERTLATIHNFAKTYVDQIVREPRKIKALTLKAKMQITISLIDYTKKWDSSQNPQFWNYIALQYGYRDNNGNVIKLLQKCVQDSMEANKRWFLTGKHNREFMATLVIHALAPRKSWYRVMEFLFDFYKENLQWEYVQNDPIIGTMTNALKQKLDKSTEDKQNEMELTISNRAYSFQQGVWKLVTLQPEYAEHLFNRILAFMNQLISGENPKVRSYEEELCREWYEQRLSISLNNVERRKRRNGPRREIAFGYTQLHPRFYLLQKDFGIVIPDVRIPKDRLDNAFINLYINESLVATKDFEFYGNELGRTLIGKSISLLPYSAMLHQGFKIKVQIICDGMVEYDSREYLYRNAIIFDNCKEISFSNCKRGKYTMLLPNEVECQLKRVTVDNVEYWESIIIQNVSLSEGFFISIGNKALAIDYVDNQSIQLTLPKTRKDLFYKQGGQEYPVIDQVNGIIIHAKDKHTVTRYSINVNGENLEYGDGNYKDVLTGIELYLPLYSEASENPLVNIQIKDCLLQEIVYESTYAVLPSINIDYNKSLYLLEEDYDNSNVVLSIEGIEIICPVNSESEAISFPYGAGEIVSQIPSVKLSIFDEPWSYEQIIWYEEIEKDTIITIHDGVGCKARISIDKEFLNMNDSGVFSLGEYIASREKSSGEKSDIILHYYAFGNPKQRHIGEIYWSDTFTEQVKIWSNNNNIYWNLGGEYIGEEDSEFVVTFSDKRTHKYTYPLSLAERVITSFSEDIEGAYHFSVIKKKDEIEKCLAEGECIIGDINKVRFKDRVLRISTLTDDENALIQITPVFIERIEYYGIFETTEGLCPVYNGIMYSWIPSSKKKIYFANQTTVDKYPQRELVNPVKIVYINDSILCITNSDDDGLYYHWDYIASQDRQIYKLTDKSYTKNTKGSYGLADLYRYEYFR